MQKTHIAMINVSAYGHINPTLAAVSELVKRGYEDLSSNRKFKKQAELKKQLNKLKSF